MVNVRAKCFRLLFDEHELFVEVNNLSLCSVTLMMLFLEIFSVIVAILVSCNLLKLLFTKFKVKFPILMVSVKYLSKKGWSKRNIVITLLSVFWT